MPLATLSILDLPARREVKAYLPSKAISDSVSTVSAQELRVSVSEEKEMNTRASKR